MALNENKYDHLEELGGSDYKIVDGEPNIKGWDVKNVQGKKIGDVDELLFDHETRKVRYLVVDLDDNELKLEEDKKVLIPIGVAELHGDDEDEDNEARNELSSEDLTGKHDVGTMEKTESLAGNNQQRDVYNVHDDGDVVIVPASNEQLMALPAYEKDHVSPEIESRIRDIFAGTAAGLASYDRNEFYDHDHFNEDKFYDRGATTNSIVPVIKETLEVGKREVETGGARITSRIVERPVEENINLREEHVNIERNPVNRPVSATDGDAFKEQELEMKEHAEVPVVSKEARVVEEVSLNKEVAEKEESIKETLRNTEVEAERIDPKSTNSDM